jgi:hypothetical protein
MDFIERLFHVSPDNGSGATEIMYLVAVAALVIVIGCRRRLPGFARRCTDRFRKNS